MVETFLDDNPVSYTAAREVQGGEYEPLPDDWRLSVTRTEPEVVVVEPYVVGQLVEFVIDVSFSTVGSAGTLRIDDGGRPFVLAGLTADNPRYTAGLDNAPPYVPGEGLVRTPQLDGAYGGCNGLATELADKATEDRDIACALQASGEIPPEVWGCG